MRCRNSSPLFLVALLLSPPAWGQGLTQQSAPGAGGDSSNRMPLQPKVPAGVILVKGAWPSASDPLMPVPEGGTVTKGVFSNPYFGITYTLPPDWTEKYKGPPPSDSGSYVLAQLSPAANFRGPARGTVLIAAQDMFFTPFPADNAAKLMNYIKDHLRADYKVEIPPTETRIAGRSFTLFAYRSPVAQLHWYVLATEIRCHVVQIVLTSRDTKLLEDLMGDLNKMKLLGQTDSIAGIGWGAVPVCIKDYARDENMLARVDPVFTERRFNPVPARIIIDKEGNVKQIHFLSAFPDQTTAISDALGKWKFKPYRRSGQPVEVETGILFGPLSESGNR